MPVVASSAAASAAAAVAPSASRSLALPTSPDVVCTAVVRRSKRARSESDGKFQFDSGDPMEEDGNSQPHEEQSGEKPPPHALSLDEQRCSSYQQQKESEGIKTSEAPSATVMSSPVAVALFNEYPLFPGDSYLSSYRSIPLSLASYLSDWFPSAPNSFICVICLGIARDPPNLESCGQ